MPPVRILRPPAPADVEIIRALEDTARVRDGHESLAAGVWRDLDAPTAASTGLLATEDDEPAGYLHLAPSDTLRDPHVVAGLLLDPEHRDGTVAGALLDAVAPEVASRGGGRVVLWITGADPVLEAQVQRAGFRLAGEQFQMRVPLPIAESPRWPSGITVRSFVPGRDDAAWLRVNNRAFAGHPDQGGWSETTLAPRTREHWFDPEGFLLAFHDTTMAGFCWTKVHEAQGDNPQLGEIYVIGVDPDFQGTGLGRALTVAGLEHLSDTRKCPTGMLYVDGANLAAVGLYRSLGFEVHRADRSYELEVPA